MENKVTERTIHASEEMFGKLENPEMRELMLLPIFKCEAGYIIILEECEEGDPQKPTGRIAKFEALYVMYDGLCCRIGLKDCKESES